MNAQEIFDTVVTHLRKQGCRSTAEMSSACLYRGRNGTKCAAGCLIPDELYRSELEGKTWGRATMKECRQYVGEEHTSLIVCLQNLHDIETVSRWEECFEHIASTFNLVYTPPAS